MAPKSGRGSPRLRRMLALGTRGTDDEITDVDVMVQQLNSLAGRYRARKD